jgi:hypothetical protein
MELCNILLMISQICSLSKGVLLMPLTRRTWLMCTQWIVLFACCTWAGFLCSKASGILVSRLWAVSESLSAVPL